MQVMLQHDHAICVDSLSIKNKFRITPDCTKFGFEFRCPIEIGITDCPLGGHNFNRFETMRQ